MDNYWPTLFSLLKSALYKVPECAHGSYEDIIKHTSEYFLEACSVALDLDSGYYMGRHKEDTLNWQRRY